MIWTHCPTCNDTQPHDMWQESGLECKRCIECDDLRSTIQDYVLFAQEMVALSVNEDVQSAIDYAASLGVSSESVEGALALNEHVEVQKAMRYYRKQGTKDLSA